MSHRVIVQATAEADVGRLFDWIAERSPDGARRWFLEWLHAVESLSRNPLRFGFAPENEFTSGEIRQIIFRTRRGRPYRAVFVIEGQTVGVLHVRGPGQRSLTPTELQQ